MRFFSTGKKKDSCLKFKTKRILFDEYGKKEPDENYKKFLISWNSDKLLFNKKETRILLEVQNEKNPIWSIRKKERCHISRKLGIWEITQGDAGYTKKTLQCVFLYIPHLSVHLSHPQFPGYVTLLLISKQTKVVSSYCFK